MGLLPSLSMTLTGTPGPIKMPISFFSSSLGGPLRALGCLIPASDLTTLPKRQLQHETPFLEQDGGLDCLERQLQHVPFQVW